VLAGDIELAFDHGRILRDAVDRADSDYVVSTGERAAAGPKGGRPPELFEAGEGWSEGSPVKRPKRRRAR